jgi:ribonucleoside-diphosphate reductase alpha chain
MAKSLPEFIKKRDGRKVEFDSQKITQAMFKAFKASGEIGSDKKNQDEAKRLTPIAIELFTQTINGSIPSVETMQDVVEKVLMAAGHYKTAKAYILYRAEHEEERQAKKTIGIDDDLGLTINQLKVIESRYLRHDENGNVIETPRQLFQRVAKAVAANEKTNQQKWEEAFLKIMANFEFVPAGGYLRSAGTDKPMLANCFVLPIEDSMEGIFDSVKWMALVHQKGGGTGFNFSQLRPKGDIVNSSGGFSSGPVSFMKVFDAATRQVMQGGFRRGANMGILNVDHPDILDFITCKNEEDEITNFNISVGVSDTFMKAVEKDKNFDLINPRNQEVVQTIPARNLFNQIVTLAWRTGDPGIIFLDAINRSNPVLDTLGPMVATNPCGEQPLHAFDVCNLGSLNLSAFATDDKKINWKRLDEVVRLAVRFLDNGVDISSYPIKRIEEKAKANRRIGLGVMGWADLLYKLEIPYGNDKALQLAEKVMHFIYSVSHNQSEVLAKEKGNFLSWKGSSYDKKGIPQRNLAITTIAPTGTISMIAETSSGIEPVFLLSYTKNVIEDGGLLYVNPIFKKALEKEIENEDLRQEIIEKIAKNGSCQQIEELPAKLKKIFVTAHDIDWEDHVKMQAAFQKYTDNAVSKTVNFPHNASISQVEKAYLLAWKLGCKGITIYRDGSKSVQILEVTKKEINLKKTKAKKQQPIIQSKIKIKSLKERMQETLKHKNGQKTKSNSIQKCPECGATLQASEGCSTCLACGFSKCSL